MQTAARLVAALASGVLAACTGGADETPGPRLDPPPDTGNVAIDMAGEWVVTELEILEQVGGTAQPPSPPTRLSPPVVGSVVSLGESGFLDLDGADVRTLCQPSEFVERFAARNQQDGRFALLDLGCRTVPDPRIADGGSWRTQCAFGSVDADRMAGFVRIEVDAAPVPAEVVRLGLYRIALTRR